MFTRVKRFLYKTFYAEAQIRKSTVVVLFEDGFAVCFAQECICLARDCEKENKYADGVHGKALLVKRILNMYSLILK